MVPNIEVSLSSGSSFPVYCAVGKLTKLMHPSPTADTLTPVFPISRWGTVKGIDIFVWKRYWKSTYVKLTSRGLYWRRKKCMRKRHTITSYCLWGANCITNCCTVIWNEPEYKDPTLSYNLTALSPHMTRPTWNSLSEPPSISSHWRLEASRSPS